MSSYKLIYTLKQITPMIHFQWNEEGACIRGSELKPKFDKFILLHKKYYETNAKVEIDDSCFINLDKTSGNKDEKALNYKVRITPSTNQKEVSKTIAIAKEKYDVNHSDRSLNDKKNARREIDKKYANYGINGLYFGNMAQTPTEMEKKYKESVRYKEDILVTFICTNDTLRKIIVLAFSDFIAVTNFGTRQNKGFGCFATVDLCMEKEIEILKSLKYAFFYCKTDAQDKLTLVDAIYSCMKGGKNMNGTYVESFIQKHYLPRGSHSDKAFIKSQGLFKNDVKEGNQKNYLFVRALLGLADHIDFKDPQEDGVAKYDGDRVKRVGTVNIKSIGNEIERYKSPFTVKILSDSIFFIYEDTFDKIKGKTFIFQGKSNNNRDTVNNEQQSDPISVPDTFDINDFIKRFVQYCNGENNDGELKKYLGIGRYKKAADLNLIASERENI